MHRLSLLLAMGLLSLPVTAQLQKGDQFLGFGTASPVYALGRLEPLLASDLAFLGPLSASRTIQSYVLPNYGFMLADALQLHFAAGFTSITAEVADRSYTYSLGMSTRTYLTNTPTTGVFVSGAVVFTDGVLEVAPGFGASLRLSPSVRFVPELAYAIATAEAMTARNDRFIASLGIGFVLNDGENKGVPVESGFRKGSIMLGTSAITVTALTDRDVVQVRANPSIQLLVGQSFAVGLTSQYHYQSMWDNQRRGSTETFGVGPVFRKFAATEGPVSMFLEASLQRQFQRSYYNRTGAYTTAQAAAGLLIFLRPDIALETGLTYHRLLSKLGYYSTRSYDLLAVTLGGRFFLNSLN
ncbi:hypothetical protein [Neolewinella litorea]|uniref:DUF5723 domain-containing protein n=1 Tax=Neolewinella litorea TaxID=2562452 RepID=A0A4S4NM49_9BACT|nr:hypothetical protein [Neolewinella litorea]THH40045.1 hypothetical protein E4021_10610 [Neolewinella litorea]